MSDGAEFIQRARDLAPMLDAAGNEIEHRRELPEHVVAALIDGGFFRMLKPSSSAGGIAAVDVRPGDRGDLAATNGSVGWCIGQNNGCSTTAPIWIAKWQARSSARPTGILAWGPPGRRTGAAGGRRLPHQRQVALRQRLPSCEWLGAT